MLNLASWLGVHSNFLIEKATALLAQNEATRSQVVDALQTFFASLVRAAETQNFAPLRQVLAGWVNDRSAEVGGFMPVLAELKRMTFEQIQKQSSAREAVPLLFEADALFTEAMVVLSELEADALVADMRGQLSEARLEIERLDKSKADFIAIAAHELKTPLTVIDGYVGMLRATTATMEEGTTGALVEGMDGGLKRLTEIVDDIVDVSLIGLNLLELRFQAVWLRQVMDAVRRLVEDPLRQRHLELVIDRDSLPSHPTYADPDRLLQVFEKVVRNAIKYTPDGGKISVIGRDLSGFVDVMVTDTGVGISPLNLPYIFDPFSSFGDVSLHSSSKVKFKGAGPGLGLTIAKGIVEAHGGTIWAQSPGYDEEACPGSTFHVMVPMRDVSQPTSMTDESASH